MEIDLHGVKHEEVGRLLDSFIWDQMKQKANGIKVITGNSLEMKRIVNEIANEYGFIVVEGFWNSGSIIINFT